MFKRSIQVKLVKDQKSETTKPDQKNLIDYVDTITEVGAKALFGATVVLGTYITLDTLRQVTVHIVKSKL